MVEFLAQGVVRYALNVPSVSPELLDVLRPYLLLAEKLGSLVSQMAGSLPKEVAVEYGGDVTQYNLAPLTLAVLKGILTPIMESSGQLCECSLMARERGIKVVESKSSRTGDFANYITVKIDTGGKQIEVEGVVFSSKHPRIVRVDSFYSRSRAGGLYSHFAQSRHTSRGYGWLAFGSERHQHRRHGIGSY